MTNIGSEPEPEPDLQTVEPVPAVGGFPDVQELQDSDEDVGVVVRKSAGQQAVRVIQLDVEAADHGHY